MDLIKEFTTFTRKVSEFNFTMEKSVNSRGVEVIEMYLETENGDFSAETTGCPVNDMCTLMQKAVKAIPVKTVVLTPRKKILIVK